MSDPEQLARGAVRRLLAATHFTTPPLARIVALAERPQRRRRQQVAALAVAAATAAVLVLSSVGWQSADRWLHATDPARQFAAPGGPRVADLAGTAGRCLIDGVGDRLVNGLTWPGGQAVLMANGSRLRLCLGPDQQDANVDLTVAAEPGGDPLACLPQACDPSGVSGDLATGPLPGTWAILFGPAPAGATSVRVATATGETLDAPVAEGTWIVRAASRGTEPVRFTEAVLHGVDGAEVLTVRLR